MKKLLAAAIVGLVSMPGWSQGTVDFRNGGITFPTDADRRVYYSFSQPAGLTGQNWVAGLWYLAGADRGAAINTAAQVGRAFAFRPDTTTLKGYWVPSAGVSPIFTFPDVAVGGSATLQVRVWDSSKFNSYDAAAAGGGEIGLSSTFTYTVPAAGSTPDKYYMDNLRAFVIHIPESSTIVLCLLGAASLFFLRAKAGAARH